jgi:hypothetical protein
VKSRQKLIPLALKIGAEECHKRPFRPTPGIECETRVSPKNGLNETIIGFNLNIKQLRQCFEVKFLGRGEH